MTDDRLTSVEQQVINLRVSNAQLATSVEHLSTSVKALTVTVSTLNDIINQGRGALWAVAAAAGTLGALLVAFGKKVLGIV